MLRVYFLDGDTESLTVILELPNLFNNHMENNFDTRYLCFLIKCFNEKYMVYLSTELAVNLLSFFEKPTFY